MAQSKIAISIDRTVLEKLDKLVNDKVFPSRSRAIQAALEDKLERMEHGRLARECAKLDPKTEQAFANEGLAAEAAEWPEY